MKVKRWNRPWYGPHRAHNQLKWWLRDSKGLYLVPWIFTVTHSPLPSHQSSIKPLERITNGLGESSQQKQATQDYFILALELDNLLMCLCVCGKKLNFLSWAIRLVFADPCSHISGSMECVKLHHIWYKHSFSELPCFAFFSSRLQTVKHFLIVFPCWAITIPSLHQQCMHSSVSVKASVQEETECILTLKAWYIIKYSTVAFIYY